MNSTDAFRRLRRADPVAAMPHDDEHDRERLLHAIVATALDPKAAARRRRLRRPAALIFVGATVLLLGGGAVYANTYLLAPIKGQSPAVGVAQQRAAYGYWTARIPLPAGQHWRGFRNPMNAKDSAADVHLEVVDEALGHWSLEWLRATTDGDAGRAAAGETWVERLRAIIPTITPTGGATAEGLIGYDATWVRFWDAAMAAARHGSFGRLARMTIGPTSWSAGEPRDPGQAHEVAWDWTLDGATPSSTAVGLQHPPEASRVRTLAEGEAVIAEVGEPAGVDLASGLFDGVPPGFDPTLFPPGALTEDYRHYLGDGFEEAFAKLWVAWWAEWVAAAKAGDQQGVAAAVAATARLESLVPATLTSGGHTMVLSLDATPARPDLHDIATQARAGDLSAMEAWLTFQHKYWAIRLDWAGDDQFLAASGGVAYPVSWAVTGDPSGLPQAGLDFEQTAEREWLTCWRVWFAAIAAGDTQKAAAEARASQALRDRMANGWPAEGGAQVALSPATVRQFDRLAAQARHGDLNGLQDWLVYQVLYETEIGKMALARTAG